MKKKYRNVQKLFYVVLILLGVFFYHTFFSPDSSTQKRVNLDGDKLEVTFLDVGQADSILIQNKGETALIDGGNRADGDKLVSYFQSLSLSSFQYVIGTHAHEDHIGGLPSVIYHFPIEHFYLPNVDPETQIYDVLFNAASQMDLDIETPSIDSTFTVGDAKIQVLWVGDDKTDLNQNSIVLLLEYYNNRILFMGDAPQEVEKELLSKDIKSDVLKVGHHGSQYSTSAHFLYQVHPAYAVISVGEGNTYGHPKDVILEKLERIGCTTYRTDISGSIHLVSDGENLTFDFLDTDTNGGEDS